MSDHREVTHYSVLHYMNGRIRLNLHFEDDSFEHYNDLEPDRAMFLLDVLRNEKPVYWTDNDQILWTTKEPVGEGEANLHPHK